MTKAKVFKILAYPMVLAYVMGSLVVSGLTMHSVELWMANNFGFMVWVSVWFGCTVGLTRYVMDGEKVRDEDDGIDLLWVGLSIFAVLFYVSALTASLLGFGLWATPVFMVMLTITAIIGMYNFRNRRA